MKKPCSKCKVEKELSEFYKDSSRKDGLYPQCKKCHNETVKRYSKTDKGKESNRKGHCKYRQTKRGRETERKSSQAYRRTERGREVSRKADQKRYQFSTEKLKARIAVNHAIRDGKLTRPSVCESCFNERFTEAHHEDYSKPLNVEWLCKECHTNLHRKVLV